MDKGQVHLYWGDGKGKTTAAMGLALRALGRGKTVVILEFLKDGSSGELEPLGRLGARVLAGKTGKTFVSRMEKAEREQVARRSEELLRQAMGGSWDLMILDELCGARQMDVVPEALARKAVLERPEGREVVITGRRPEDWMLEAADYVTEMRCHRHPYHRGLEAREGIEY